MSYLAWSVLWVLMSWCTARKGMSQAKILYSVWSVFPGLMWCRNRDVTSWDSLFSLKCLTRIDVLPEQGCRKLRFCRILLAWWSIRHSSSIHLDCSFSFFIIRGKPRFLVVPSLLEPMPDSNLSCRLSKVSNGTASLFLLKISALPHDVDLLMRKNLKPMMRECKENQGGEQKSAQMMHIHAEDMAMR